MASTDEGSASAAHDRLVAIRNALRLGGSLLLTLVMAFGIRLLLTRYLGPERNGSLKFADAFATSAFVVLSLGLDVYIRRELAIRVEHATDFFGGILVTRIAVTVFIFVGMGVILRAGGRSVEEQHLVYTFGVGQFLLTTNLTLAAMLHARSKVAGLSLTNMGSKVLWCALVIASLFFRSGEYALFGTAVALLVSEAVKTVMLFRLVQQHVEWEMRVDLRATFAVLGVSLPFYLNTVAHTLYSKLGVSMLAFMSSDEAEVGRYGAASDLAALTLLVTPLINWVLSPLYAKARRRSEAEFDSALRRSLELILIIGFPVSLMLGVGAEFWMQLAFGQAFVGGALALRILAPLFLITYVAMIAATSLINLERGWTLTFISVVGLIVNPVLNWVLIHLALRAGGSSVGGAACALADVGTELVVTSAMLYLVGKRAFDARTGVMIAKTLVVCVGVVLLDHWIYGLGPIRLVIDAAAYTLGVLGTRAVRLEELLEFVRSALRNRHRENPI